MFLFNDWLLSLFGAGFVAGSGALLITTFGKLIGVFSGSTGNLLNMTGHQKDFRNIMTAATLLNIVLCMVLIPLYGLMGSAIASSAFIASWNIACVVYIRRKLGIRSYYSPF